MSLDVRYETVQMVHDSWDVVKRIPNIAEVAGELLFRSIFRIAPGAWALYPFGKGFDKADDEMFEDPQFKKHARLVIGMVDTAIHLLGPDLEQLEAALLDLGARHVRYGVFPEHYPIVGQALLETLGTALGEKFTPQLKEAWTGVYGFITKAMLEGANQSLLRLTFPVLDLGDKRSVSLDECISSMLPQQKDIYYSTAPQDIDLPQAQKLQEANVTILLLGPSIADTTVTNLQGYLGRKMTCISDANLDLRFLESAGRRPSPTCVSEFDSNGLNIQEAKDFCEWFQDAVGLEKVTKCTPTCGYASLPARVLLVGDQGTDSTKKKDGKKSYLRLPKLLPVHNKKEPDEAVVSAKQVEINPSHNFIVEMNKMRVHYPEIAGVVADQLFDNCMVQAGLTVDCRRMVNRMNFITMGLMKAKNKEFKAMDASYKSMDSSFNSS